MFKKIAGLFLAAAVMCSSAAITASAAEAEDDAAVAAADQSGEVSADGSSEVSADASSEVEAGNVIKFDVKKSGWNNVKTVFCHVWKADGSGDWPAWQSKKENVSTILQQVSLHMIFQRQVTQSLSQTEEFTV